MNLRQLDAFRATLRTGSITGASRALAISQPSVTRLIKELERSVGFALFVRSGRGSAWPGNARRGAGLHHAVGQGLSHARPHRTFPHRRRFAFDHPGPGHRANLPGLPKPRSSLCGAHPRRSRVSFSAKGRGSRIRKDRGLPRPRWNADRTDRNRSRSLVGPRRLDDPFPPRCRKGVAVDSAKPRRRGIIDFFFCSRCDRK